MAYVGNPIDTQNTFQSLQGKRFNGDGSTTDFTLDVAPSSTLDIEVFVGNVRQDPNSAYTLSGTTLSFTGAPPSGTNNIYVVHQAKSVGTITPGANSVGVTELNLSDGSSGQFIKTDGSGTLSFASVASLAGIDDQSSSNDDQLTITDTAVVINEDSDDVDFRVESNGNANMLFVSGGNDVVGIGAEGDLGVGLHIKSADSGASVGGAADELVIEGSGNSGMSILSGTSHIGGIYLGDSGDVDIGKIEYDHSDNSMRFTTNDSERMRIRDDGEVLIGTTNSSNVLLKVEQSANEALGRFFNSNTSASATLFKIKCDNSTGGDYISFNIDKAGSSVLNIEGDGDVKNTNNSYGSISDERIKKDITDANSQWDDIKALKIKNYKLKTDDESPTQLGVIAQDLETDGMNGLVKESRPEAYLVNAHSDFGTLEDGTADNGALPITDEEGKITGYEKVFTEGQKVKSVKYSVLYMKAIKALQESMTRIETLEAKVKALEEA